MSESISFIELTLRERRSLETALAELLAKYRRSSGKSPDLARMIRQLEAEILYRERMAAQTGA
ncbi:MAG: hypothetical protein JO162_05415 [Alphaproteobacteria bacterium]|nr:hypothetical protein [Alphaproteobacteria bacterium]MBV9015467.1 hypothetical protein [Alphaproteobacteria bacterium]MBV9152097.1 hypothetical protein [Alphaproteobacteria bacterium]MBV9583798.1 hypothetical protein [Alphaproteobacteria bacterium]MBV9964199.1 hypothetical protein [Alphaproteobacteria bacterium]